MPQSLINPNTRNQTQPYNVSQSEVIEPTNSTLVQTWNQPGEEEE